MIIVYVTCKNNEEAYKICKQLLDKKLIACGNIISCKSIYSWNGEIEDQAEELLLMKSVPEKFNMISNEITKIHSYDIPCILKIDAEANKKFKNWVLSCLR